MKILSYIKSWISEEPVEIRGHHLKMIADYAREGDVVTGPEYGRSHKRNAKKILGKIASNPELSVRITDSSDSICKGCRSPGKTELCAKYPGDDSYSKLAGLTPGETYTSAQVINAVQGEGFKGLMEYRAGKLLEDVRSIMKA